MKIHDSSVRVTQVQVKVTLKMTLRTTRSTRKVNLTVDRAVRALKWIEGDPIQFEVKDPSHPGFYIRVSKGGTKQWVYRYTFKKRVRRLVLGHYPAKPCADAFADYKAAREKHKSGIDPLAIREAERSAAQQEKDYQALTLSVLFHQHFWPRHAVHKRSAKNDAHYFEKKIEPILGSKPAASVTPDDVERLIRPIEKRGYNTGRLTLAVLRKMYNWAVMPESAEFEGEGAVLNTEIVNPCRLYKLSKKYRPAPIERYLRADEIRRLWIALPASNSARILKLQLLTGCRVSEVCGMAEIELERHAREWVIPSSRTKNKRPHLIPLTETMLDLIGPRVTGQVFSAKTKEGHTSYSGPQQLLDRTCASLKIQNVTTHTMRRTFITNMARLGVALEVRDRLTNHTNQAIDSRYNMHDYIQQKKNALIKWDLELGQLIGSQV